MLLLMKMSTRTSSWVSAIYSALDQGLSKEALKLTTAALKKSPPGHLLQGLHALALDRTGDCEAAVALACEIISGTATTTPSTIDADAVFPLMLVLRRSPSHFDVLADFLDRQPSSQFTAVSLALRFLSVSDATFPTTQVQMVSLKGARENPQLLKAVVLADRVQGHSQSRALAESASRKIPDADFKRILDDVALRLKNTAVITTTANPAGWLERVRDLETTREVGFGELRAFLAADLDKMESREEIARKYLLEKNDNLAVAKLRSAWDILPVKVGVGEEWALLEAIERFRPPYASTCAKNLSILMNTSSASGKALAVGLLSYFGADSLAEKILVNEFKIQNAQWRALTFLLRRPSRSVRHSIRGCLRTWLGDLVETAKSMVDTGQYQDLPLCKTSIVQTIYAWSAVRLRLMEVEDRILEGLDYEISDLTGNMHIFDDRDFSVFNAFSRGPENHRVHEWFFAKTYLLEDIQSRLHLLNALNSAGSADGNDLSQFPVTQELFHVLKVSQSNVEQSVIEKALFSAEAVIKSTALSDVELPYAFACLTMIGERIPRKSVLRAKDGAFRSLCTTLFQDARLTSLPTLPEDTEVSVRTSREETEKTRAVKLAKLTTMAKNLKL